MGKNLPIQTTGQEVMTRVNGGLRLQTLDSRAKNNLHYKMKRAGVTPGNFWADRPPKSGVAPARFGVFSMVTFARTGSLSPTLQTNCSRHRVKNLEKTKLKCVVLTFFILFSQVPAQERNRQSTSVTKCTVAWRLLAPNSWRMSDSLTRPTFHPR